MYDPCVGSMLVTYVHILQGESYKFARLLKKYLPAIGEHFEQDEVASELYLISWFMSSFSATFPITFAVRVFGRCKYLNCNIYKRSHLAVICETNFKALVSYVYDIAVIQFL